MSSATVPHSLTCRCVCRSESQSATPTEIKSITYGHRVHWDCFAVSDLTVRFAAGCPVELTAWPEGACSENHLKVRYAIKLDF